MNIKKEVVYYNRTLFSDLRRAIIEHRAKDYEAHIKEILKINRKKVGF